LIVSLRIASDVVDIGALPEVSVAAAFVAAFGDIQIEGVVIQTNALFSKYQFFS
jgi:hypothetical protein